jgi:hypothetical protein
MALGIFSFEIIALWRCFRVYIQSLQILFLFSTTARRTGGISARPHHFWAVLGGIFQVIKGTVSPDIGLYLGSRKLN